MLDKYLKWLESEESAPLQPIKGKIRDWICADEIDISSKKEILAHLDSKDFTELEDRFYRDLEFGTGGMRGIQGAGTNRINAYVVQKSVQGLANFIKKSDLASLKRGVAIAYDCRINSREFSEIAARVLSGNGISVYLFKSEQTTPQLSFAIRWQKCLSGLVFTASHNPSNYNGMKVYWEDGAQIVPPQDEEILVEVFGVKTLSDVTLDSMDSGIQSGRISWFSDEVVVQYQKLVLKTQNFPGFVPKNFGICYTPLHGTGAQPAKENLNLWGFKNLFIVSEQEKPNGLFPTVKKPNPEEPIALKMLVELVEKTSSPVAFASDPDSDRLAVVVRDPKFATTFFKHQALGSQCILLNGNQTGALLLNHILRVRSLTGSLKPQHCVIKTIVTSELLSTICASYGVRIFDTLTGFKWIASMIREWEISGNSPESSEKKDFLFGTEESFGYMTSDMVRDKDGISALCLSAEMAAVARSEGKTLVDTLGEIFEQHGCWHEDLLNFDLEGRHGAERILRIMTFFRENQDFELANNKVVKLHDFLNQTIKNKQGYIWLTQKSEHAIPNSNVLQFVLSDETKVSLRPSGTEPKLKVYISAHSAPRSSDTSSIWDNYEKEVQKVTKIKEAVTHAINQIK